jgi:hypothetical protein
MKNKKIEKKKKQRTVTKNQLLMLEGLVAMRNEVRKQFTLIERTIAEIVQEPEDGDGYWGLVSDFMWDDSGARQLLKDLEVKIVNKLNKHNSTKK